MRIGLASGVVIAVLLVCTYSSTATAQSHPVTAADADTLTKALAACDRGEGASVHADLERLAAKYPHNFAANEALGLIEIDAGKFSQALPYLERAAAAEKTNAAAQANLGTAYLEVGNTASAVQALQRAAAIDGSNVATLVSLGGALYRDKQTAAAAKVFAKAAALDPANTDVAYNLAVALYDLQKYPDAVASLQRIPESQRTDAVESLLGDSEERAGHFQEALAHIQRAASLNPSEPNVYAVAIELLRHWSWDTAAQVTSFGVGKYPESRRMKLADGIAAFGSGKYVQAAAIFGGLLALDPANESYGSLLGKSCAAAGGATAPECESLVAFAEAHPNNAQIDVSAAVSLLHQSSPERYLDQAERLLKQAISIDPKDSEAYYQLGVLQQQRLQWKESAASLEKAVALRPSFAEAHYRLSRAYSHTAQQDLAKREIALQQQYSQQEKDETNARLKEVTIFLTGSH